MLSLFLSGVLLTLFTGLIVQFRAPQVIAVVVWVLIDLFLLPAMARECNKGLKQRASVGRAKK